MARKKKDSVGIDEVREEMTEAPTEGSVKGEEGGVKAEEEATPPEIMDQVEAAPFDTGEGEDKCKVVSDTRLLRVKLTDHELVLKVNEMLEALDDAERAKESLKTMQADVKAQVEEAMERANDAKRVLRRKQEDQHVECEEIHNFTRGAVYVRRKDTGEVIQVRDMMHHERQMEFESDDEAPEATENDAPEESGQETAQAEDGAPEGVEDAEEATEADDEEAGELVGVGAGEEDGEALE